jgi:hypothetical protein
MLGEMGGAFWESWLGHDGIDRWGMLGEMRK